MTQPTRWLDNHDTSAELRELLRAGTRPPRFPRVALAATVIPFVQKAALAKTGLLSSTAVLAIKATSIGLAIGLGSLAAVKSLSGPEKTAQQTSQPAAHPNSPAASKAARIVEKAEGSAPLANEAPATTAAVAVTIPLAATGIAAEAQLLERARSLLDESPARALLLTNEHRERFSRGQMTAERELIAIDALLRLGRQKEAEQRAQPLLADGASQVFAQRLRNLLDRHAR